LRSRGCQVSYFVDAILKEAVEGAGATWYPFRYPSGDNMPVLPNTLDEAAIAKYVTKGTPAEEYNTMLAAMIYSAEVALPALLQDLQHLQKRPSLIVYDPFVACARVAAHVLEIPAVCSLTMPGPGVLPKPEALIRSWESKAWVEGPRKRIQEQYGFDVFKHGLHQEFYSPTLNIVTTTKELFAPPPAGVQAERYGNFPFQCVGPLVNFEVKRVGKVGMLASTPKAEEDSLLGDIDAAVAAGQKLIYLSMGTVATGKYFDVPFGPMAMNNGLHECTGKAIIQHVFRACFEAMGEDARITVVMAVGQREDVLEGMPAVPSNFIARKSVPQLELLKRSSAFITHCGANSMHEAILMKVPMVAVPLFGDQPINATSVARSRAGVAFHKPLSSVNAESMQSGIEKLLELKDGFLFQKALTDLSAKMVAAGGASAAVDAIMDIASKGCGAKGGA
jgi:hypothetical protein